MSFLFIVKENISTYFLKKGTDTNKRSIFYNVWKSIFFENALNFAKLLFIFAVFCTSLLALRAFSGSPWKLRSAYFGADFPANKHELLQKEKLSTN